MTDPQNQSPNSMISTVSGDPGHANLIYILYLVGLISGGITALIGVIMAYIARDEGPDWVRSHYQNQINVFWKGIIYYVAGFFLMFVLIGFLVMLAATVWYIVRTVIGMQNLSKSEPYANPQSWGI